MAKTVVGLFDTFAHAQEVVQDLVDSGFSRDNISLLANDASGEYANYDADGGAADGAMAGAGTGALVGGVLGLLVGVGALAIPGVGPVLAAGPLAATLTGAGIGAVAGGLLGALTDLGVPEEDAGYYTEGVRRGGTLVTVAADDNMADQAVSIMNRHGAVDIDERAASWQSSGWTGYDANAEPYDANRITQERTTYTGAATTGMTTNVDTTRTDMDTTRTDMGSTRTVNAGDEISVPIVEEELQVGKRQRSGGGVRVYTGIEQVPVQEQVTLREEHVEVERRPVNRAVTDADFANFQEGVIEVTETSEEAVVAKTARVVEEVVISKEASERVETISDTVRRTDVNVEQINTGTAVSDTDWNTYSTNFRSDYDTNYANSGYTYEQYTPAYRYGYDLASDTNYRGRQWNDVENDARTRWEERNPGTWDQFKGAVRRSWDDVTGRR